MIRQLEPEDSSAYFQIRLKALQLHPAAFGTGAEDWSKATDEQVKNLLRTSSDDDFVLGSFQNGTLAGVVGLIRERKNSVRHKGTVWGMVVLPEFRTQGIGRALLEALIARAAQNEKLDYIRAVVTISELNATRVFEKCGFEKYGLEKRGIKDGTTFYDQNFLALTLRK